MSDSNRNSEAHSAELLTNVSEYFSLLVHFKIVFLPHNVAANQVGKINCNLRPAAVDNGQANDGWIRWRQVPVGPFCNLSTRE